MSGVHGGYSLSDRTSAPASSAIALTAAVASSNLENVRLRWLVRMLRVSSVSATVARLLDVSTRLLKAAAMPKTPWGKDKSRLMTARVSAVLRAV